MILGSRAALLKQRLNMHEQRSLGSPGESLWPFASGLGHEVCGRIGERVTMQRRR